MIYFPEMFLSFFIFLLHMYDEKLWWESYAVNAIEVTSFSSKPKDNAHSQRVNFLDGSMVLEHSLK